MKPITTRKEGLIDHMRTMITQGYELLHGNSEFEYIKSLVLNSSVFSDDFLKQAKEVSELKWRFREALNGLSIATEETEIAINEIRSLMEREKMRHKKVKPATFSRNY